jgi:hypothetical protein
MGDITNRDKLPDDALNRDTGAASAPPEDANDFHRKTSYVRELIKLHEVVVRGGGFVRCPCCRALLEFCVWGYSGLGPSTVQCPHCEEVCLSHRRNWAEMAWRERFQYVWLSFAYMGAAALSGFFATTLACNVYLIHSPLVEMPAMAAAFWALFVAGIQIYRLLRSLSHTRCNSRQPGIPSLLNPDFGLQWKLLVLQVTTSIVLCAWLTVRRF